MKKWIRLVWIFLCAGIQTVKSDGGFISESAIAKVTIPDQRALIYFKDGVETLVIDTSVQSTATNLAWIVPLPDVPEIEAATPGLFTTLEILFSPTIIHDPDIGYVAGTFIIGTLLLIIILICTGKNGRKILLTGESRNEATTT
jgi:hypothetical protein